MTKIRAAITGVGGYVPDYILTNQELETMVETTDEWITSRTGIKERRILKGENKGVSVMGIEAVKEMLAKTKTDPKEIDLAYFCYSYCGHDVSRQRPILLPLLSVP